MRHADMTHGNQRGATLIVSMIFLIALTLIGISTINSSTMELLMANNTKLQTETLTAAENASSRGEKRITEVTAADGSFDFTHPGDGFYPDGEINPDTLLNAGPASFVTEKITGQSGTPQAEYVVEYLGCQPLPGESLNSCSNGMTGSSVHLYRITARARHGKGTVRVAQSTYAMLEAP